MNGKRTTMIASLILVLAILLAGSAVAQGEIAAPLAPLGIGFAYQGELRDDLGNPINAICDFRFRLWDAAAGGAQVGGDSTAPAVEVDDGRLTALVNATGEFGASAFAGQARWLEVALRCPAGAGDYTTLSPRQPLLAVPYARYAPAAGSAPWGGLSGVPAGFADGVDDDTTYGAGTGLTLSGGQFALATAYRLPQGCANGQIPEWDGAGWSCGDDDVGSSGGGDITAVTAGTGLAGGGDSGDVTLDLAGSYRLPQSCANGQLAEWTGTDWACGDDDVGTGGGGGDITGVNAGTGLTGGGDSGDVTLYLAGSYRLPQVCSGGQLATWNATGSAWGCGDDSDTTYEAGSGLMLTDTLFSADASYLQRRISSPCPSGWTINRVQEDGSLVCLADDNTTYTAGSGLTLSGTEFNVAWGGSGTLNSAARSDHGHLGQTWIGSDASPLIITGTFGSPNHAPLVLGNTAPLFGDGLRVNAASDDGVQVEWTGGDGLCIAQAGDEGVQVYRAGNPSGASYSSERNGFEVDGAQGNGLYVGQADQGGVHIYRAGNPSATSESPYANGFEVGGAQGNGLYVGYAGLDGVWVESADDYGLTVNQAGLDGVHVFRAGNPSDSGSSSVYPNGFEVGGAEGYGLYIGRSDLSGVVVHSAGGSGLQVSSAVGDGLYVGSAGWDGLYVDSAGWDGVHVCQAGSPSTTDNSSQENGFEIEGAEGNGLRIGRSDAAGVWVNSSGGSGVFVNSAEGDGLYVDSAVDDGVQVASAGDIGVYANTAQASHEWGLYTPDKIYAGTTLVSGGPLMIVAQNGGAGELAPGDVVVVSGLGAPLAGSEFPVPEVVKAGTGAVAGVVYRHFVAEEELEQVEHEGQVEQRTSLHTHSAEGPIAPGDYLLIVVLGPAQVKVDPDQGTIRPGMRLAAGAAGQARALKTVVMDGVTLSESGSIVGIALEPAAKAGLIWVLVNPQ